MKYVKKMISVRVQTFLFQEKLQDFNNIINTINMTSATTLPYCKKKYRKLHGFALINLIILMLILIIYC